MDTSGFYKSESGFLLFGSSYVLAPEYKLFRETHDDYSYPVDGWYWFDTEGEARLFFDLPLEPDAL